MSINTIQGHPYTEAFLPDGGAVRLTVCGECERMRTILFLSKDRWLCTSCRNEGVKNPESVNLTNPARK